AARQRARRGDGAGRPRRVPPPGELRRADAGARRTRGACGDTGTGHCHQIVRCHLPNHSFQRLSRSSSEKPMNALSTAIKFFQDCGLFIYPSILIMALGLAIAIERFVFLTRARTENRKVWAEVLPVLQKGQFKDAQGMTARSDAAVGKIVN